MSYTLGYNPASQLNTRITSNDSYVYTGSVNVNRAYAVNGLNQYTSAGPATFSYDLNGNLTGDGSSSYLYDTENRLVSASGVTTAGLRYDPLGRLYETSGGAAGITRFLYDGDELVAEYGSTNTLLRRYVHGPGADDPLIWYEGSGIASTALRRLRTDHQGSVTAVTNNAGAGLTLNSYDEWGIPGASNAGRFQYTGQAWIPELRMYHYKARIYSPTLGRFLQTDPIGYDDQINLYAYVGNDPVNGTDPSGENAIIAVAKFGSRAWKYRKIEGGLKRAASEVVKEVKEDWDALGDDADTTTTEKIEASADLIVGTNLYEKTVKPREISESSEHDSNATPSNKPKHEAGQARKGRDRGGEKGDESRRPPRKPPGGKTPKGGWPPKEKKVEDPRRRTVSSQDADQ